MMQKNLKYQDNGAIIIKIKNPNNYVILKD